jgi:hypothetical protein
MAAVDRLDDLTTAIVAILSEKKSTKKNAKR